jgi:glutaredoxin
MEYEYEYPSEHNYTIYSKSGCSFCEKAKNLLVKENIEVIDCDDYLIEDKKSFLEFIKNIIGFEYKTFPIIFGNDGTFIGGFKELQEKYVKPKPPMNDFPDPFSVK